VQSLYCWRHNCQYPYCAERNFQDSHFCMIHSNSPSISKRVESAIQGDPDAYSNSSSHSVSDSECCGQVTASFTAPTTISAGGAKLQEQIAQISPFQPLFDENCLKKKVDEDDLASIFTGCGDILLSPSTKESLVSAFSDTLFQTIDITITPLASSRDFLKKNLPEYLKEFSDHLKKEEASESQKLARVFIRQQRKYVSLTFLLQGVICLLFYKH